MQITLSFLLATFFVILYYYLVKIFLRKPAYYLARALKFTKNHNVEEATGAAGFILVVLSHLVFVLLIACFLGMNLTLLGLNFVNVKELFLGVLLGTGLAGTSAIFTLFLIKCISFFMSISENKIYSALMSGWLNSYSSLSTVTPVFVSIPFIILQLACEELVFRSIFLHYFLIYGVTTSILFSTLLFTMMQLFQMPNLRGALFPFVGAIFMGLTHGYMYLSVGSIWPFVISHSVFFLLFTM